MTQTEQLGSVGHREAAPHGDFEGHERPKGAVWLNLTHELQRHSAGCNARVASAAEEEQIKDTGKM